MENSYTKWLELEEERKEEEQNSEQPISNLNKIHNAMNGYSDERFNYWAKEIVKAVYDEDNYYEAYERVEKMLKNFLK